MDNLKWLQKWYVSQCNGCWEHEYGITIVTLDNPGWRVIVNLKDTSLQNKPMEPVQMERSEDDWIYIKLENDSFHGTGGSGNLEEIVQAFRTWATTFQP